MPYCDEKQVLFLHIPRTGGSTMCRRFNIKSFQNFRPKVRPSPQHLTCEMLRERLGAEKYESYYKFTFVRNPWARILSSYFWRQTLPKKREVLPFSDFIQNVKNTVENNLYYDQDFGDHFIPQTKYTESVDDIFRYDHFELGISKVAVALEVSVPNFPPKKSRNYDEYWNFYDDRSRDIIAEIYSEEIEQFGFEFSK